MVIQDLIQEIWSVYVKISELWKTNYQGLQFNLRNTTIKKVYDNSEMCRTIIDYRNFVLENFELIKEIKYLKDEQYSLNFECRIKNLNSIDQKLTGYVETDLHEHGEVATNKCFNDLLGMRYIYPDSEKVTISQIEDIVSNLGLASNIKIIDSNKIEGYKAIHVYFRLDNFSFPWELQFWNEIDEQSNKENHEIHKQKYKTREIEYKTEDNKL